MATHDTDKAELERLRVMMYRLVHARYANAEWNAAMDAIGHYITALPKHVQDQVAGAAGRET